MNKKEAKKMSNKTEKKKIRSRNASSDKKEYLNYSLCNEKRNSIVS